MADENIADDVTCLTALPDTQWVEEVKDRVDTRYILHPPSNGHSVYTGRND